MFTSIIEPEFDCSPDSHPFAVGDDSDGEFSKLYDLMINMDDFIVFGDALTADDVAKLAQYYKYEI